MSISAITEKLLAAKKAKGITFADLEQILGLDGRSAHRRGDGDREAGDAGNGHGVILGRYQSGNLSSAAQRNPRPPTRRRCRR